jgi:DUF4097 and DUF4098 domain-containing protein YvlB
MNNEAIEQIERMFKEGKISDEDRRRLEEALGMNEKNEAKITKIEITSFKSEDMEIIGDEGINAPVIIEGSNFVQTERDNSTVKITPKILAKNFGFLGLGFLSGGGKIEIRVPKNLEQTEIRVVSGDISISNLNGKLNLSVVSGDVQIDGFTGSVKASSVSGDIDCKNITGPVDLSTKSGDIKVLSSTIGGAIKAYSGDISVENSALSKIKINTFNGDLETRGTQFKDAAEISTSFGDAEVEIDPKQVSIIASTLSGNILDRGNEQAQGSGGTKIGEGPILVSIKTRSGDIKIRRIQ